MNKTLKTSRVSSHKPKKMVSLLNPGLFAKREREAQKESNISQLLKSLLIDNMSGEEYIPSPIDRIDLVEVHPVDLLKSFGGRGLFAKANIKKGTCLGQYTGLEYTEKEFDRFLENNSNADNTYAMTLGKKIIDAKFKGNFTRYINCSDNHANIEFIESTLGSKKIVKVEASKEIEAGRQLLIDYNVFDEKASKTYFFLNPEDGWLSSKAFYEKNQASYQKYIVKKGLPFLNLKKDVRLYLTNTLQTILDGENLDELEELPHQREIALPCLMLSHQKVVEFHEKDVFTPVMLAAYLGQINNVKYLVDRGANMNQQQNQSGYCAAFFALEGYAEGLSNRKSDYLNILKHLVANQVNLYAHDRVDQTVLHKALTILSDRHFSELLQAIKKSSVYEMGKLFSYIDASENDLLMHSLAEKRFGVFISLIKFYPDYFKENLMTKDKQLKELNKGSFERVISYLAPDECAQLIGLIQKNKVVIPKNFIKLLDANSSSAQLKY